MRSFVNYDTVWKAGIQNSTSLATVDSQIIYFQSLLSKIGASDAARLVFTVNFHNPLMEPLRPQAKRFQFGIDQLRKRRAVTFNG